VSERLFDNAVLEAVRAHIGYFGRAYFVFRALRPPDIDLLSAVLLGEAFTERILAALHGEVEKEEERQRRARENRGESRRAHRDPQRPRSRACRAGRSR
jgi:hypothetical protein